MSAFERFANAYAVLFTVPGVPLVYYGDEIGLPGAGDPDNRRFMQWSGYSAGQLFLRDRVTTLAHVRAAHAALRRGSRTTLSVNADTMAYRMSEGGDQVIVIINRADSQTSVGSIPAGNYLDELSGNTVSGPNVTMPARSARVLTPQ
jgi:glycosidase